MKSATFKWIILLCTIVIVLLVTVQLYWLYKIYAYEQKEFSTNVVKSIRGLYEDFNFYAGKNLQRSIEMPDKNTFLFKIDKVLPKGMLVDSLSSELEQSNVFTDCNIALYDPAASRYLYEVYVPSAASSYPTSRGVSIPMIKKDYSYVYLFFPHRNKYILNQIVWWILSSVILLLVLISLGVSLFYLYRQKFLNEVQNDFIRNVTHEFQTPLTTLMLGLSTLSKPSVMAQPEKITKYVNLMEGQTAYLKQHIENLAKVMKTDATGLKMQKTAVKPNELITQALKQLYAAVEEKHAKIELQLENLNTAVLADNNSLYVAILNVISNAIKYSKEPLIIIQTKSEHHSFWISVKDNGIGIPRQYQKKLFKKFYRVPTGDIHDVKGLGLGLYFVKKVIDAHHGTITVKSIEGVGTEFIIELPKN